MLLLYCAFTRYTWRYRASHHTRVCRIWRKSKRIISGMYSVTTGDTTWRSIEKQHQSGNGGGEKMAAAAASRQKIINRSSEAASMAK